MENERFSLTTYIQKNENGDWSLRMKQDGDSSLETLKNLDPETFTALISKLFSVLISKYADQHPEIESTLDFYNDMYDTLSDYLNDRYNKCVTRDTLKWVMENHNPDVMKVIAMDKDSFLEELTNLIGDMDEI